MKNTRILFSLAALFFFGLAAQAQQGKARLDVNYSVGLPTGSFRESLNNTSFRGFQGALLFGVNDKLSLGLGTGFQDFYQKDERQLYKLSDGSDISAVLSNSIQVIPLMAEVKYSFNPNATIQPYAALGVGGNLISYTQLLGEFGSQEGKFGFAARPEAGIRIPFKKGEAGFNLGASYNIMPFKEAGFTNLNHLGIHAGLSLPLRK